MFHLAAFVLAFEAECCILTGLWHRIATAFGWFPRNNHERDCALASPGGESRLHARLTGILRLLAEYQASTAPAIHTTEESGSIYCVSA